MKPRTLALVAAAVFLCLPNLSALAQEAGQMHPDFLEVIEGQVESVSPLENAIVVDGGYAGLFPSRLVADDCTRISTEDGRNQRLADIREGDRVSVCYRKEAGGNVAEQVVLLTPTGGRETSPGVQPPGTCGPRGQAPAGK